jgi:hypothetical protein
MALAARVTDRYPTCAARVLAFSPLGAMAVAECRWRQAPTIEQSVCRRQPRGLARRRPGVAAGDRGTVARLACFSNEKPVGARAWTKDGGTVCLE